MSGSPANGSGLTWEELDELADYVAGTLTGASADRVATLIRTDHRWAAAHAALTEAEPVVRAALQAAAADPPPLPDDVAARLDALGQAWRGDQDVVDASRATRHRGPASPRRPGSAPPTRSRAGAAPGRSRRRMLVRVAAAVLVLGAIGGFTALAREFLVSGAPASTAADAFAEGMEPPAAPNESPMVATPGAITDMSGADIFSSGTDYRRDTLPQAAALKTESLGAGPEAARADDGAFSRLSTQDQLRACITAVGSVHPGSVVVVDYARFEGEPAVILLVQQENVSTVVAVGLDCGIAGPDVLASVQVR